MLISVSEFTPTKITKDTTARILGGIATSRSPTIGFALDHKKQHDPAWAPIFAAYQPVRRWLAEKLPVVYNDHATSFFFDHYSALACPTCTFTQRCAAKRRRILFVKRRRKNNE